MDKAAFVQKVKMLCLLKGVKPTNACKDSGVGTSFINDVERGRIPSVERVQMLAAYLGVTTSELLGEEIEPDTKPDLPPTYPPGYDSLRPEDKELIDNMIRRLILEKNQEDGSSPSNGAGAETA